MWRSGWRKWLGVRGEDYAARYLKRHGYRILARNAQIAGGEIDLIARQGDTIVFIEVKTRVSLYAGTPAEAVDSHKQRQLTRLAQAWLKRYQLHDSRYHFRFDVVGIVWPAGHWWPERFDHIQHAFDAVQ